MNWVAGSSDCYCRSASNSIGPALGWTSNFLGVCSTYQAGDISFSSTTCKNVAYANGMCVGVDGSACLTP